MSRPWPSLLALLVIVILCPFLGGERLIWSELSDPESPSHRILFEMRFPRAVLTFLAGGILASLGGTYQALFHNPLAEPYLLGVSSSVTLGIAVAELVFHFPTYSPGAIAVGAASAASATLILLWLSLSVTSERLVLFGMGLNFVLSSALFLLLAFVSQHMGGGTSVRWLFGQLPWIKMSDAYRLVALTLPFVFALWLSGRWLDALGLGDSVARTLGVSPRKARIFLLFLSSVLITILTSLTGAIGFVGLVVPHTVRLVFHPRSLREQLALAFIGGAAFLMVSDVISRIVLPPFEFPIGILTTLIGGPAFLYLLWRK